MRDSRLLRALERLELFLYRKAALVVSVTHSFRDNLRARGIDPERSRSSPTASTSTRFSPRPSDEALARRTRPRRQASSPATSARTAWRTRSRRCSTPPKRCATSGATFPHPAARRRRPQGRARRTRAHARARQRRLRRLGAEERSRALLVAARRLDHPPARDAAVRDRHPVEAVRVHGDGDPGAARRRRRVGGDRRARGRRMGVRARGRGSARRARPQGPRRSRRAGALPGALPGRCATLRPARARPRRCSPSSKASSPAPRRADRAAQRRQTCSPASRSAAASNPAFTSMKQPPGTSFAAISVDAELQVLARARPRRRCASARGRSSQSRSSTPYSCIASSASACGSCTYTSTP